MQPVDCRINKKMCNFVVDTVFLLSATFIAGPFYHQTVFVTVSSYSTTELDGI